MNRWVCTAPPGVNEWHEGIPDEVIVECEHRATAMRLVADALPKGYKHLVTNYRYRLETPS